MRWNAWICPSAKPCAAGNSEPNVRSTLNSGADALAAKPDWRVVNLDALTYAGNLANLADVEAEGIRVLRLDAAGLAATARSVASTAGPAAPPFCELYAVGHFGNWYEVAGIALHIPYDKTTVAGVRLPAGMQLVPHGARGAVGQHLADLVLQRGEGLEQRVEDPPVAAEHRSTDGKARRRRVGVLPHGRGRRDHFGGKLGRNPRRDGAAPGQARAAGVGAVDLPVAVVVAAGAQEIVDREGDDPREEHDEGVGHAL